MGNLLIFEARQNYQLQIVGALIALGIRAPALSARIIAPVSGAIAQLGERIVRNDEVVGSIPTSSTMFPSTCWAILLIYVPSLAQSHVPRHAGLNLPFLDIESMLR